MRLFSSRSSLFARHAFVSHQYIGSLLFFGKIYLSAHMITVLKQRAPPGVLGIWGEWLFIFRELGSTDNYFQGFWEQAQSFGDLGSPAKK